MSPEIYPWLIPVLALMGAACIGCALSVWMRKHTLGAGGVGIIVVGLALLIIPLAKSFKIGADAGGGFSIEVETLAQSLKERQTRIDAISAGLAGELQRMVSEQQQCEAENEALRVAEATESRSRRRASDRVGARLPSSAASTSVRSRAPASSPPPDPAASAPAPATEPAPEAPSRALQYLSELRESVESAKREAEKLERAVSVAN